MDKLLRSFLTVTGYKDAQSWDDWEEGRGDRNEPSVSVDLRVERFAANSTGDRRETAAAFDKNGKLLQVVTGTVDKVEFTQEEFDSLKGAEAFVHNHPEGGAFSPQDIVLQNDRGIGRMVVTTDEYIYTATKIKGTNVSASVIKERFKDALHEELDRVGSRLWEDPNTERAVWAEVSHAVWDKIGGQCGITFTKVKR